MKARDYLRLARRESRRAWGRLALFIMCVAVGVASVVVVDGLSRGVTDGIRTEGRRLMAADVAVEGNRPVPEALDEIAAQFGVVDRVDVREFVSVAIVPDQVSMQLVEVKVVEGDYPFYGELLTEPMQPLSALTGEDSIIVAPEVLEKLNLKVGDELSLGGVSFRIAGTVVEEPDKLDISFTIGPRIFLSPEGLARTSLASRGSRIDHSALLKLPDSGTAEDAERLKQAIESQLPDAEFFKTRTFTSAQASLQRSFQRIGRYLGLIGLMSLLVGGVGVAQVVRAWIAARTDDVAVLRCLGVTPGEAVILFTIQVAAMGLLASLLGAMIGQALLLALPHLADASLLPGDLVHAWQPLAVLRGILLGVGVAVMFTLPYLWALRKVPPSRVLRRETEPVKSGRLVMALGVLFLLLCVWLAGSLQTGSWWQGAYFVGGLVATTLTLMLAAWAIVRLVRFLPRDVGSLHVRHGLGRLVRPGAGTMAAIVSLGLGVAFVFSARTAQDRLGSELLSETPENAPTAFFVDVQSDQWPALAELLKDEGSVGLDSQPIVTGRFVAIDGVPVSELMRRTPAPDANDGSRPREGERGRSRWQLTREQRITYGDSLPRGNQITVGDFPSGAKNGISVEENFARSLGLEIGSQLTIDIQGVPVDLIVTSLRSVDWRTFGINFFLLAEPGGPLTDAPQQRVAVARIPPDKAAAVQSKVVSTFPNITVIPIKDVLEKVMAVLEKLGAAVRGLGLFIVVAGTVVLGCTIAASQARRAREVALLKTIGMTRRDVLAIFAIEYSLVGAVAAVVGIAAGLITSWVIVVKGMELPWSLNFADILVAFIATVAIAVLAGLGSSLRALNVRPAEILRSN